MFGQLTQEEIAATTGLQSESIPRLVLALPRHDGIYTLGTDARIVQVGLVLLEERKDGTKPTDWISVALSQ